jgi:hypothetical protein
MTYFYVTDICTSDIYPFFKFVYWRSILKFMSFFKFCCNSFNCIFKVMGCHRNYLFDHKIHYQYMFCCVSCSYPIIIISFSLQDTHLICLNYLYSNISVSKMFYFVIKFYMNKLIIVIVILYFTNVILYNCFPCIKEI